MKAKKYIITAVVSISLAIGVGAYAHGSGGSSGSGSAMGSGGYGMMGGGSMMGMMGMMGGNNMMGQSGSGMMPQNKSLPDINHRNQHIDNMRKYDPKTNPDDEHSDWSNESDLNQNNQNKNLANNPS